MNLIVKFCVVGIVFILVGISCKPRHNPTDFLQTRVWHLKDYSSVKAPFMEWNQLDMRLSLSLWIKNSSQMATGRIRIERDSLIYIQIRPSVGIMDVFRVIVRRDSIFMIDLINNQWYSSNTDELPINISVLQQVFMAEAVRLYEASLYSNWIDSDSNEAIFTDGAQEMLVNSELILPSHGIIWDSKSQVSRFFWGRPEDEFRMDIYYLSYQSKNSITIPNQSKIEWKLKGTKGVMDYSVVKWETELLSPIEYTLPYHWPSKSITDLK
jgi:hypothetical protein